MGDFLELNSFILAFSLYWFVFILTLIHFHESNTRRNFSYTLDIPSKFRACPKGDLRLVCHWTSQRWYCFSTVCVSGVVSKYFGSPVSTSTPSDRHLTVFREGPASCWCQMGKIVSPGLHACLCRYVNKPLLFILHYGLDFQKERLRGRRFFVPHSNNK